MKKSLASFIVLLLGVLLLFFVIFIREKETSEVKINCGNVSDVACWHSLLIQTLEKKGLNKAFNVLAELYNTEPGFVSECHSFTHDLGSEAYNIYKSTGQLDLTPKTSYCGYGFYHGFMETLLSRTGNIKEAEDFCAYADKQLENFNKKTGIACFHGIGHGAVDGDDLESWGNPQKIINPALNICKLLPQSQEIYECGTGVFNSLAIALNSGSYGLNKSEKNPYSICLTQEDNFKKSCFEQMNTRAMYLANSKLSEAIKFIFAIKNSVYSTSALEQLVASAISHKVGKNENYSLEIKDCQSLSGDLRNSCFDGLIGGILEFGRPGEEYLEALDLCKNAGLHESDKKNCYNRLISTSKILYSVTEAKKICQMIDIRYQNSCDR